MVEKKYFVKVDDKEFQATFVNNETEISIGDEVFKVEKSKSTLLVFTLSKSTIEFTLLNLLKKRMAVDKFCLMV